MPSSRRAFLVSALPLAVALKGALSAALAAALAADGGSPPAVVQRFYDALLSVMKDAKKLSFDQRYQRIAPAVSQAYNLPLMTRLTIGPAWPKLQPAQQQALTEALSRYTISVYANRFDDFNGERFQVDPNPTANANGTVVQTALIKSDGDKVVLNYLMRRGTDGAWQVIDVYLSGTISQLATQRSEFSGVLQQGGADALIRLLEQRIASLRTGQAG